jgi:hypothetical protein
LALGGSVPKVGYSNTHSEIEAKTEMEHSLTEYWLAEAEEWKRLRQSIHSKDEFRIAQVTWQNPTT